MFSGRIESEQEREGTRRNSRLEIDRQRKQLLKAAEKVRLETRRPDVK
jgi:hypothetical protein